MTQKTTLSALLGAGMMTAGLSQAALIHHWAFDETTGLTTADSVGGNNGTWQEGGGTGLSWVPGKIGNAADLNNGTAGRVNNFNVGTLSSLTGSSAISISVWLQTDAASSPYRGILSSRSDSSSSSWAFANEGAHIDFHTSGAGNQLDSADVLTVGPWFHVVATWDNSTGVRNIYIDGALSTTNTFTGGVNFGGDGTWLIGSDDCCSDRDFDGRLDDLAVFDNVVSASEAAAIFAGGNAGLNVVESLAVPEPSTSLLGALAALALLRRRR